MSVLMEMGSPEDGSMRRPNSWSTCPAWAQRPHEVIELL